MSILNVLVSHEQLVVAADTLAHDALTGAPSAGAKLLLIPHYNLVLACRGSAQFFLRMYELSLQASFRADFTMEQLIAEFGLVIDQLWPNYQGAAERAGLPTAELGCELVLGGWSPRNGRMMATAYAKSDIHNPTVVQPITGQLAAPGDPLRHRRASMAPADVLEAGKLQAKFLNRAGMPARAGGDLLCAVVNKDEVTVRNLGAI